jgi:Sigma-70 region 2
MIVAFIRTESAAALPEHAVAQEISSGEVLIRQIAGGDQLAMQILFARHRVALYRWLLRLVRDEALAENLLSDVFLDVWRQAAKFEGALVGFYLAIGDRALQGALGAAPQDRCGIRRGGRSNHSRSSRQSRARAAEKEPGRTGAPILGQALA